MATIEERAKAYKEKWLNEEYYDVRETIETALTEQDCIARKEERERCIKIIIEMLSDPYEYYSVDGYTHNEYVDEDKVREAIENETE